MSDDVGRCIALQRKVVVLTVITTTPGKPATGSQRKTASAVLLFSVPATIRAASTSQKPSFPASGRKSFPAK